MSTDNPAPAAADYYDIDEHYTLEEITVTDASSLARTVTGTAVGNFTEWFDFGVYSYVIAVLSRVFFPQSSGWATVATFAGLAISFMVRPIGGIFWGAMGDRVGRKKVLAFTVILMAFGTFALGLVPGYASIGIWAPVLLFVLRGIQGFSTGGEYVGAMTFLVEHSPDRKRGYLCSFLPVGTLSGYILGAVLVFVLQVLLSDADMLAWGWRVPFLLAGPLGLVGLYVRLRLEETPAYERESEEENMGNKDGMQQFRSTVVEQWRPILVCMGLVLSFNVTNYMLTGYMPTYLFRQLHVPENRALLIVIMVMVVLLLIVTLLGRLSDRIGRKPIMYAGSVMLVVLSWPMFLLIFQGGYLAGFFGTLPMGLMLVCFMSTEPSTLPALFPTNIRSGATAVAFNISVSLFGGTTPLITSALVQSTGDLLWPAYILIIAGAVGVVSVYLMPEPVGTTLRGSGPLVGSKEEARKLAALFHKRRQKREHRIGKTGWAS